MPLGKPHVHASESDKKLVKVGCYLIGKFTGSNHIPVFTYHSIDTSKSVLSVSPDTLRKQFEFFRDNGYEPLSLEDYFQYKKQNKSLKINFSSPLMMAAKPLHTPFPPEGIFISCGSVSGNGLRRKNCKLDYPWRKIILDRLLPTLSESEVDIEAEKTSCIKPQHTLF